MRCLQRLDDVEQLGPRIQGNIEDGWGLVGIVDEVGDLGSAGVIGLGIAIVEWDLDTEFGTVSLGIVGSAFVVAALGIDVIAFVVVVAVLGIEGFDFVVTESGMIDWIENVETLTISVKNLPAFD